MDLQNDQKPTKNHQSCQIQTPINQFSQNSYLYHQFQLSKQFMILQSIKKIPILQNQFFLGMK